MRNSILNEDCFETMSRMDVGSVDCVLTSPPYNTSRIGGERAFNNYENRYDIFLDNKTNDEYIAWSIGLFNNYDRILRADGCVLYNISYSSENTDLIWLLVAEIIKQTKFTTADVIVWKKSSSLPNNVSPNKLTRIFEFVFVFCRKTEINTFFMNKEVVSVSDTGQKFYENKFNFIDAKNNDGSNTLNKATFSSNFVRHLLLLYTSDGDLVYDSFMGTGTTAEACIIEGRDYVGSELSEQQCGFAEKRLNIRISQPTLF